MAKIKNVSGENLTVPWVGGRLVLAGAVIDVPDNTVEAYTNQTEIWEAVDSAPKNTPKEG